MSKLSIKAIQTEVFHENDNLLDFIIRSVPEDLIKEKIILAITSKIVSIAEGCLVPKASIDKLELIKNECDHFIGEIGRGCYLTIKNGLLIPTAGIDESNSENSHYITLPKDASKSAYIIWEGLRAAWNLLELGIILTDSRTSPLRRGVTGVCLAHWGFLAVEDKVGDSDLFGRPLKMTHVHRADALASAAVLLMGEGGECQPLVVINCSNVKFRNTSSPDELSMQLEEDLYYPLIKAFQTE